VRATVHGPVVQSDQPEIWVPLITGMTGPQARQLASALKAAA
jgi:hypothetical protein